MVLPPDQKPGVEIIFSMKCFLFYILIFTLHPGLSDAQSNPSADHFISGLMDTAKVTGLCIGIIKENKVFYTKGFGYRVKEKDLLNDTSTCFYGASLQGGSNREIYHESFARYAKQNIYKWIREEESIGAKH
jgi:hypothetical protein